MNRNIIYKTNCDIKNILDNNLNEYFNENLKNSIINEIERIIIDECYYKYRSELFINDKNSLKYSIQFLDNICQDLYEYWNLTYR